MTTSRPIFTPIANLDFNNEDEDDLEYDPFAGLSMLSTFYMLKTTCYYFYKHAYYKTHI